MHSGTKLSILGIVYKPSYSLERVTLKWEMIHSSSHKNYKIGMIEETNYKSIEGNAHLLLKIPVRISFFF